MGLATPEDIDTCCKLGLGHASGPFESIDVFGVEAVGEALSLLYENTGGDKKFATPVTLRKMAEAGYSGRRAGKGFYDYTPKDK